MRLNNNYARFDDNKNASAAAGSIASFPNLPMSADENVYWSCRTWDPANVSDRLLFTDSASSPTATGLEWTFTEIGAGSSLTYTLNTTPNSLNLVSHTDDGDGWSIQQSVGSALPIDFTATGGCLEAGMYAILRMKDANNDAATLEQSKFFMGFAAIDTSIFTAVQHFVGIAKADASSVLKGVCDDDSVAPTAATNQLTLVDLATAAASGTTMANKFFMLGFRVRGQTTTLLTADTGQVDFFADFGIESTKGRPNSTHLGSMAMGEVPGAAMTPTIVYLTGDTTAHTLSIAKIVTYAKYRLGTIA